MPVDTTAPTHLKRLWLVAAAVVAYLLVLHVFRDSPHITVIGLAFQYVILLPVVIWVLLGMRGAGDGQTALPYAAIALTTVYLMLAFPVARREYEQPGDPVDESCYSFQAKIFRSGRVIAEPLPGATPSVKQTPAEIDFQNHVLTTRGWFTHFPPGWPLLLVVGQWLGAPWVLNPLLGAALIAVTYAIGRDVFSANTGQLAVVMTVLSPFFLVNAVRLLSHMLCSVLVAVACWMVLRGLAQKRVAPFAVAFAMLALAIHVRPFTAFAEGLVLGGAALWYARDDRRFLTRVLLAGIGFGALAALSTMAYYYACTGNPLISPYAARVGADVPSELTFNPRLIFYLLQRFGPHTFKESVFSTFPFLFLPAGYAVWQERERVREVRILAWVFLSLVLAYLFHTERSFAYYGSRFHFEGLFAAMVLAARGAELLAGHWALPRRAVMAVLLLFAAMQIAVEKGMTVSLWQVARPYHEMRMAVEELGSQAPLAFLRNGPGYNARFMNFNAGDWQHAPVVYVIDADPGKRDEWACRFGRPEWMVLGLDGNGKVQVERGRSECAGK